MAYCTVSAKWTKGENKLFEDALVRYSRDTPDKWHNIARAVGGGKTADDVKRYYELLLADISQIESGQVPLPVYKSSGGGRGTSVAFEELRFKHLKL